MVCKIRGGWLCSTSMQSKSQSSSHHFSLGGYAGNNFHDYTDIVIPLYLTSRQFDGEVKFLITDRNPWWINKFQNVLRTLSRYELIDIDKEENVHCFTTVTVGLKRYPKELSIDPSKSPYSMKDFRQFLRSAYSLKKDTAIKMKDNGGRDLGFSFFQEREPEHLQTRMTLLKWQEG